MHCKLCNSEVEEGLSMCPVCGTATTKYASQLTGEMSEKTLRNKERMAIRPAIIPIMSVLVGAVVLLGPVRSLLSALLHREKINAEQTNYLGSAFGAAGIALSAFVLLPIILAFIVLIWGIMTQREWAWGGAWVALGVIVILGGMLPWILGWLTVRLLVAGIFGFLWMKPDVKEWYGAG